MGDVGEEERADGIGDLAEARIIDRARISARSDGDHFGLFARSDFLNFVVIDALRFRIDAVGDEAVQLAGEILGRAVRQMPAVAEVHAQHRVAGLEEREVHGHVGLRTGVRLDVGVARAEELLGAVARDVFSLIDKLAATIIALARVAFGVLVGHDRADGFDDGGRNVILAGDHFQLRVLPSQFVADGVENFRIEAFQFIEHFFVHSSLSVVAMATVQWVLDTKRRVNSNGRIGRTDF